MCVCVCVGCVCVGWGSDRTLIVSRKILRKVLEPELVEHCVYNTILEYN